MTVSEDIITIKKAEYGLPLPDLWAKRKRRTGREIS